jgi:hypothetical protein
MHPRPSTLQHTKDGEFSRGSSRSHRCVFRQRQSHRLHPVCRCALEGGGLQGMAQVTARNETARRGRSPPRGKAHLLYRGVDKAANDVHLARVEDGENLLRVRAEEDETRLFERLSHVAVDAVYLPSGRKGARRDHTSVLEKYSRAVALQPQSREAAGGSGHLPAPMHFAGWKAFRPAGGHTGKVQRHGRSCAAVGAPAAS